MKDAKAFAAGFISTIVFHQGVLALLHALALTTRAPYASAATWPLHIPAFLSLALWGGVWAIALARLIELVHPGRWVSWIVFGAILPSLVAWFIVMPLKGVPMAAV